MAKKMNFSGLNKQQEDSRATVNARSSASGSNTRAFNMKAFGNAPFIKFEKDKTYTIKFVPYEVDETHPKVMLGKMDSGDAAYVLDFTRHIIGPNNVEVICPKGTHKHSCPICDRAYDLRNDDPNSEEAKALKQSRRVMYNVVVIDEDPEKVQIISTSHFEFEKELQEELNKGNDEGEPYSISDLCVGAGENDLALRIKTCEKTLGTRKYVGFTFKVVNNKVKLDDDALLEQAVPLHKALIELTTKELEDILYGVSDNDEEPMEDIPEYKKTDEEEVEEVQEEAAPACKYKYEFGVDCGLYDECDDCPMYEACRAEKKRLRAASLEK